MSEETNGSTEQFGPNDWMVEQMYRRYLDDPDAVSSAWQTFFADYEPTDVPVAAPTPAITAPAGVPMAAPSAAAPSAPSGPPAAALAAPPPAQPAASAAPMTAATEVAPPPEPVPEGAERMIGITAAIAEAMDTSLEVPTATSVRTVPAKLLEVNRRILNNQLRRRTRGGKVSFTHLIGWAIVRAMREMPDMNVSYEEIDGKPHRVRHPHINLGLAVDQEGRGGERVLIVPNIKGTDEMDFEAFWHAYEGLIAKVRAGEIGLDDFANTTASLTNPGMIGTVQSVPRLMKGQGVIVGVGAIIYPPEYQAADAKTLARLGIGRVISLTSTYDHRVIQGATSGRFLDKIHRFLVGEDGFYDEIFTSMRIPYTPARWAIDDNPPFGTPEWAEKQARVFDLINHYRVRGHLIADLDPLHQQLPDMPAELDILTYGLTIWDLDREFATNGIGGHSVMELGSLLGTLRDAYCRTIGIEYMHIQDPDEKLWIQDRLERPRAELTREERVRILERLNEAESFESFLHTKYVGHKRFGLEGVESLIPLLSTLLDDSADDGIAEVVIGMAHRGRLNVLANIIGKPLERIFREFEGDIDPDSTQGSGDVKYHLGAVGTHEAASGAGVQVEVVANPSHLEAVDPVLVGVARAKMEMRGTEGHRDVLPVLLHGDAAFAGQGVVVETLNLSQLRGYRTGGTVHIIVNNQVGFTTSVKDARSSTYATDVAKTVQAPIIHVNADDPEAVVRATRLAFEYRQTFNKDVVVDMIGYRRRGHNEGDEPSFTQPIMYRLIDARPSVRELYLDRLVSNDEISMEDAERLSADFRALLSAAFDATRQAGPKVSEHHPAVRDVEIGATAVDEDLLRSINDYCTTPPPSFTVHPKLTRMIDMRRSHFDEGVVDWAMAEYLAIGSLADEGAWVRFAGEDSKRGTFSHRHAALVDYQTGGEWLPLQDRTAETSRVRFVDSLLSEFAAVGFEYGYSVEHPNALVVWEAQFGDFANGAQVIFDQFVAAGEDKWGQYSGLVVLLPHGFEGQGPEHSSARLERYLQSTADDNVRVIVPSTAGQMFHLLRRQVHSSPQKPAFVMSPKSLLRTAESYSPLSTLTDGGFESVLADPRAETLGDVRRIVLCTGKLFYDIDRQRVEEGDRVAVVRLEELYPFPGDRLRDIVDRYPADAEIVWAQEEPRNMGAATWIAPRVEELLERPVRVIAREASASPATGSNKLHHNEQQDLVAQALKL